LARAEKAEPDSAATASREDPEEQAEAGAPWIFGRLGDLRRGEACPPSGFFLLLFWSEGRGLRGGGARRDGPLGLVLDGDRRAAGGKRGATRDC